MDEEREEGKLFFFYYFFRNERLRSGYSPTNNERAGEWGGERPTDVGGSHPGSPAAHGTHYD